jgi:hypothetical protein
MVIIITYDLRTPKDYHDFFEAIKAQGQAGKWWHYMASTWLLSTTKTPQQIVDAIGQYLDQQDSLFVCEITANYQGRLPKAAWDWIEAELRTGFLAEYWKNLLAAPVPVAPVPPPNPFFGEPDKLDKLKAISDIFNPKKPGER